MGKERGEERGGRRGVIFIIDDMCA